MKGLRQLAAIEPMVLGPLHGVPPEDWHRGTRGRWSVAQIVGHLAAGVDLSSAAFEKRRDKMGMVRRSTPGQAVLRNLLLTIGRFPPGRKAGASTTPPPRPDPDQVAAQFRMGVERFTALAQTWPEERQQNVFVQHPFLGDLNLPEWIRFHYIHCRHHAKQIHDRLKTPKKPRAGRGKRDA